MEKSLIKIIKNNIVNTNKEFKDIEIIKEVFEERKINFDSEDTNNYIIMFNEEYNKFNDFRLKNEIVYLESNLTRKHIFTYISRRNIYNKEIENVCIYLNIILVYELKNDNISFCKYLSLLSALQTTEDLIDIIQENLESEMS